MKNYILPFLLGIFITISINAAVDSREIIVKPATPISVAATDRYYTDGDRSAYILTMVRKGYILKSCTSEYGCHWTIVMEKY